MVPSHSAGCDLYSPAVNPGLLSLTFLCLLGLSSSPAEPLFPGREVAKTTSEVRDSFLGYFVGIVDSDSTGHADAAYLHEVLPEFQSFLSLPFEYIRDVSRWGDDSSAIVTLVFRGAVSIPIPFRVLWDTPGSISASERVVLRETRLRASTVGGEGSGRITFAPFYLFDLTEGDFFIDFDPWIDVLLGRAVDDVHVVRVLLFGFNGKWYGALMGKGYERQLVVGYFDFTDNRILIPVPRFLWDIGTRFVPP